MDATTHQLDQAIITRYAGQPARLPAELRTRIEASWSGAPVLLYALADLSPKLELTECWVALGATQIAISVSVNAMIAITAGSISTFLVTRPTWLLVQRWLMGTMLAGFALRMAFEAKRA